MPVFPKHEFAFRVLADLHEAMSALDICTPDVVQYIREMYLMVLTDQTSSATRAEYYLRRLARKGNTYAAFLLTSPIFSKEAQVHMATGDGEQCDTQRDSQ